MANRKYNQTYYERNKKKIHKKQKVYYKNNKEKIKKQTRKYAQAHKKQILKYRRKYAKKHRERMRKYFRKYRKEHRNEANARGRKYSVKPKNRKKMKKWQQKWRKNNKLKMRRLKLAWVKLHYKIDPNFRLTRLLRQRIHAILKGKQKAGSAVRDLGCSVEFLKKYLGKKFYGKMTWDNQGSYWELDHIEPLWKFDLTDRKQFLKACNYKNLQPLTIADHKRKTRKDTKECREAKKGS